MVGDRADAQRALFRIGRVGIQSRRLHLDGEHAHALPQIVRALALGGIEVVGRENVADLELGPVLLCRLDGLFHQLIVRDRGIGAGDAEGAGQDGVGAGALADDDVHDVQLVAQRTGGADTDDVVHIVEVEQLPAVDADRRDAHAGGHDRDRHALPGAGVALDTADVVDKLGVGEEGLGDKLRAQRIAGHQHGLGDLAGLGVDVRGGDRHVLLPPLKCLPAVFFDYISRKTKSQIETRRRLW